MKLPSHPLLLGHRGLRPRGLRRFVSRVPAENSLAAFEYALSQGCDGFEFDVRRTRDGRDVLWHDAEFDGRDIASRDYATLTARDGARLPCLEDALQQFGARAYLDIELKLAGHEEVIVAALKQNHPQRGYIVSSFFPECLLRLRAIDEQIPLGYICDHKELIDRWRDLPIKVFLPQHYLVQPQVIEDVHRNGRQIMTWTVNSPRRMKQLAGWGIDGLISDDPRSLCRTLGTRTSSE